MSRGGHRVTVDVDALRAAIDGRTNREVERAAKLSRGQVAHILRRGTVREDVLDAMCGALGIHESEVLA